MIRNIIWYVFSLPDTFNKKKKWDLLLHQYIFTLDDVKFHVKIIQKVYRADKYMVQNLTWSVAYLRSTLSSSFLQKVLTLVSLKATGPKVYVSTMITVIYHSYASLVETLIHIKESQNQKLSRGEHYISLGWNLDKFWLPWECWVLQD